MTNVQISKILETHSLHVLTLMIATFVFAGCRGDSGPKGHAVHVIEVADPGKVVTKYGESLDSFLSTLIRSGETTYVVIADHADGSDMRIPEDPWFWSRWDQVDAVENEIRKAANAAVLTDNYETRLHSIYREVYGKSKDLVLTRNTVLGGPGEMEKRVVKDTEGSVAEGPRQQIIAQERTYSIKEPYSWKTILGTWVWIFGLIATLVFCAFSWYHLGKKVHG